MNYDFKDLDDLLLYIREEGSHTNEYRGSVILPGFDMEKIITGLREEGFDDRTIITIIISANPVLWAHCWLKNPQKPREPLRLFHYQKSMLNCQCRFKVTRCGRQVGKTMCMAIDMVWTIMTQENKRLLYVAPYQNQVKVLYEDTMMRLIQDVSDIKNSIVKSPSHPYYQAIISNGSEIKALTAGTRSGQKGSSVRGMSMIDKLYLDEVDYMGTDAISSIMPTIFSRSESAVWASSTPTGKREDFYHWCTDYDSRFICKECKDAGVDGSPFHYPSHISPLYSKDTDDMYKKSNTASAYEHEVLAEFGEEFEGVFRHVDIDACLALGRKRVKGPEGDIIEVSYTYDKIVIDPKNLYIMGVDWNKESTGVQIIVTEYNPNTFVSNGLPPKYFRLFRRECVTAKEFTERGAVARILTLCKEIPIGYVYADEGYGTLQIQAIRKILSSSGAPELAKKIVAINMKSNIDIVDPVTKKKIPKPVKAFMVDSAARVVEDRRLILPDSEDEKVFLVGQMREYIIERRGASGQPIYSPNNEDVLTAFMLSILGFVCEYNEVVKGHFTQRVLASDTNIVTARAAEYVISREIQGADEPKTSDLYRRKNVFRKLAGSMGVEYESHMMGDELPDNELTGASRVGLSGQTGRGSSMGGSERSKGTRRRFGGSPSRSKF